MRCVFRVDTEFDRRPSFGECRAKRELFAGGNPKLLNHKVGAGDHFSNRMLDLDTGVHLNEEEFAACRVEDKFDRSGVDVVERFDQGDSGLCHALARRLIECRRWGFLDKLLMAPLHTAVALAKMHVVAVVVAKNLNLDMANLREKTFEIDFRVSKRRFRFSRSLLELRNKIFAARRNPHAAPAAATACLQQERKPEIARNSVRRPCRSKPCLEPGTTGIPIAAAV